ncbi:MAG: ABC transporter substrate binding protein [Alphaproteobacteria bacterium]
MIKLRLLFVGLFVLGSTYFLVKESISTPRILVLQSYGSDYSWTHDVDVGIKKILEKESTVTVRWHYMDTKNHPEKHYLEKIGIVSKRVIDQFKPSVIIAVDDDAQEYVTKYYNNDPNIKIVFSGVNATREEYAFDKANNVTGILERLPVDGIVDSLQLLAGTTNTIKIIHVSDESKTVKLDDKFLHAYKGWKNVKMLPSLLVSTFDDWKIAIKKACKDADYIVISNYRKIYDVKGSEKKVLPKEIMAWTMTNATKPIIGMNAFIFEDGARLAIATSPYEQGEVAAQFALDIIKTGVLPPHTQTKQFVVGIDEKAIMQGGEFFGLPKTYVAYALYSGKFRQKKSNAK